MRPAPPVFHRNRPACRDPVSSESASDARCSARFSARPSLCLRARLKASDADCAGQTSGPVQSSRPFGLPPGCNLRMRQIVVCGRMAEILDVMGDKSEPCSCCFRCDMICVDLNEYRIIDAIPLSMEGCTLVDRAAVLRAPSQHRKFRQSGCARTASRSG